MCAHLQCLLCSLLQLVKRLQGRLQAPQVGAGAVWMCTGAVWMCRSSDTLSPSILSHTLFMFSDLEPLGERSQGHTRLSLCSRAISCSVKRCLQKMLPLLWGRLVQYGIIKSYHCCSFCCLPKSTAAFSWRHHFGRSKSFAFSPLRACHFRHWLRRNTLLKVCNMLCLGNCMKELERAGNRTVARASCIAADP